LSRLVHSVMCCSPNQDNMAQIVHDVLAGFLAAIAA
jgi:hypothetical protein